MGRPSRSFIRVTIAEEISSTCRAHSGDEATTQRWPSGPRPRTVNSRESGQPQASANAAAAAGRRASERRASDSATTLASVLRLPLGLRPSMARTLGPGGARRQGAVVARTVSPGYGSREREAPAPMDGAAQEERTDEAHR